MTNQRKRTLLTSMARLSHVPADRFSQRVTERALIGFRGRFDGSMTHRSYWALTETGLQRKLDRAIAADRAALQADLHDLYARHPMLFGPVPTV
jgi:uncharacterized alpha-E superfamily protein